MFLLAVLLASSFASMASIEEDLEAIDQLKHQFQYEYAPKALKEEMFGWDLKKEIKTLKEVRRGGGFQEWKKALKDFFYSIGDHHAKISFQSTAYSKLPFQLAEAEGRYFVVYVDEKEGPDCPLQKGDEILGWNGEAIDEVVNCFFKNEFGRSPCTRSWFEKAVYLLTKRSGSIGIKPEKGEVEIDFLREGKIHSTTLSWKTKPEYFPGGVASKSLVSQKKESSSSLFDYFYAQNSVHFFGDAKENEVSFNPFVPGSKFSFLPPLGHILWESWDNEPYHAYLFETFLGAKVGYLRIPHFEASEITDQYCLRRLVRKLNEKGASLLVVDVFHNPGGRQDLLLDTISLLIDQPIKNVSQWELINPRLGYAVALKSYFSDQEQLEKDRKERKSIYSPEQEEYLEHCELNYANFILDQASQGKKISDLFPNTGVEEILPHPKIHFSGPLLILIDPLAFSCAELFPAILKDAGRATLFGSTTAGAGGFVKPFNLTSNRLGIHSTSTTWSIWVRSNGEVIEGVGVKPDIEYHFTPEDYLQGFQPLRKKIVEVIDEMLQGSQ